MQNAFLNSTLEVLYPPLCVACGERVGSEGGLCAGCWGQMRWHAGVPCPLCGQPLLGDAPAAPCDACLRDPPPWQQGAVFGLYEGPMAQMVLALKKNGDTRLAAIFAQWLRPCLEGLGGRDLLLVPVPLHWRRLWQRRFNQSALIAQHLGRSAGREVLPDALLRPRFTPPLEGLGRSARFAVMQDAISPHPRRRVAGRHVVLIDDVFTSGATFRAATAALFQAGAAEVSVLALARVTKAA